MCSDIENLYSQGMQIMSENISAENWLHYAKTCAMFHAYDSLACLLISRFNPLPLLLLTEEEYDCVSRFVKPNALRVAVPQAQTGPAWICKSSRTCCKAVYKGEVCANPAEWETEIRACGAKIASLFRVEDTFGAKLFPLAAAEKPAAAAVTVSLLRNIEAGREKPGKEFLQLITDRILGQLIYSHGSEDILKWSYAEDETAENGLVFGGSLYVTARAGIGTGEQAENLVAWISCLAADANGDLNEKPAEETVLKMRMTALFLRMYLQMTENARPLAETVAQTAKHYSPSKLISIADEARRAMLAAASIFNYAKTGGTGTVMLPLAFQNPVAVESKPRLLPETDNALGIRITANRGIISIE